MLRSSGKLSIMIARPRDDIRCTLLIKAKSRGLFRASTCNIVAAERSRLRANFGDNPGK